jgi:methyl-accepting chemotaxis protein
MNALLRPAIWLTARVSFRSKLLGTFLIFALPLATITAMFVQDAHRSIGHIERQRDALALQLPTLRLIRSVQDHYAGAIATAYGDASLESSSRRSAADFERNAAELLPKTSAAEADTVRQKWKTLESVPADDVDAIREAHDALLNDLFRLREEVADRGELGLNDDVVAQGLAELLDSRLIPLLRNLGQARDVGVGIVTRKKISMGQRESMSVLRGSFDSLLTWMDDGLAKAGRSDPQLQATLAEPMQALNIATLGIEEFLTTKLINTSDFDISPADFHAKGTQALDAAMAFAGRLIPEFERRVAEREERSRAAFNRMLFAFGVGIAIVAYFFAGAYSSILGSIGDLERAAHAIADGDLRTRVTTRTRDEISHVGNAFNTMAESFSRMIARVIEATSETRGAADDLAVQASRVTSASARQSDAAAQSSSAVEQLAVSFQQVSAHAQDTSGIATHAAVLSSEGLGIADLAVADMRRIVAEMEVSVQSVLSLEERSRNVERVVGVITEIAEQTNLLALNAAIEAARAGEVGRGFAVVADEVRKLADRTGTSTREIGTTIREMREQIQRVVLEIQHGSERINASSEFVDRIKASLVSIHGEVARSANLVSEIVLATQAQTEAGNEIARGIEKMAAMAEENHATSQQTGEAINELRERAESLRAGVSGLRV